MLFTDNFVLLSTTATEIIDLDQFPERSREMTTEETTDMPPDYPVFGWTLDSIREYFRYNIFTLSAPDTCEIYMIATCIIHWVAVVFNGLIDLVLLMKESSKE